MNSEVLLLAVVQPEDLAITIETLHRAGLWVTRVSSQGGFLRKRNCTLLIGLPRVDVPRAMRIFAETCRTRTGYLNAIPDLAGAGGNAAWMAMPLEVEIGGATIFTLMIERHAHFPAAGDTDDWRPVTRQPEPEPGAVPGPGNAGDTMKLVLVIVAEPLVDDLLSDLTRSHYQVTLISTTGGFLRRGNATLLIGVQPGDVEAVLATVQSRVRAGNPPSSATTFVLRTESHVRV